MDSDCVTLSSHWCRGLFPILKRPCDGEPVNIPVLARGRDRLRGARCERRENIRSERLTSAVIERCVEVAEYAAGLGSVPPSTGRGIVDGEANRPHSGLDLCDRKISVHPHNLSHPHSEPVAADHAPRVRMRVHRCPEATVLALSGDVDAANAQRVQDFATSFVQGENALIVDLSGIVFFGARGISVLIAIRDTRRAADAPWALVPSRVVSRVLQLTSCDTELSSAASVRDALRLITDASGASR